MIVPRATEKLAQLAVAGAVIAALGVVWATIRAARVALG